MGDVGIDLLGIDLSIFIIRKIYCIFERYLEFDSVHQ